jgi:Ca2+-binding EF-hand superfamily protein
MCPRIVSTGSGGIDREEFSQVMKSLGFSMAETEADAVFALADSDHDGVVSREEFIQWSVLSRDTGSKNKKMLAAQMFQIFDKDGDGSIQISELVDGLKGMKNTGLTTDEIVALALELDANSDGEISLEEFEAIIVE